MRTPIKNKSDKDMVRAFTRLTTNLKIREFNPGFYIMYNEASPSFKNSVTAMYLVYKILVSSP